MKKGFTLIELIGILLILGLVFLISVPVVTNNVRKNKENKYKDLIESLELSTANYIETNFDTFPQLKTVGQKVVIELQTLVDKNYVKAPIINPKTDEEIPLTYTIEITVKENKTLSYKYSGKSNGVGGYVKDDLIIWYDGYHQSVNKSWPDQSGLSNNAKVEKGIWDKYYWNQNDENALAETKNPVVVVSDFSFQVVLSDLTLDSDTLLNGIISSETPSGYFLGLSGTPGAYSIKYYANTLATNASSTDVTEEPRYITLVVQGKNLYLYLNGNLIDTKLNMQTVLTNTSKLRFGVSSDDLRVYGKYHSIMVYNRALNEEEVLNNYEINKLRYGV